MKEYKRDYIEKQKQFKSQEKILMEKIDKRYEDIKRAERSIERLKMKHIRLKSPSWVDALVKPIGVIFAKEFDMDYEILGPFGLRAYVTIYWKKDKELSIIDQLTKSLTLIPLNLEEGELGYETGRKKEGVNYHPMSLGGLNGMDREVLPLPDSFEEIKLLIHSNNKE